MQCSKVRENCVTGSVATERSSILFMGMCWIFSCICYSGHDVNTEPIKCYVRYPLFGCLLIAHPINLKHVNTSTRMTKTFELLSFENQNLKLINCQLNHHNLFLVYFMYKFWIRVATLLLISCFCLRSPFFSLSDSFHLKNRNFCTQQNIFKDFFRQFLNFL